MNTKHKTSVYLRQDAVGAVVTALLDQVVVSIELWPLGRFDEQHERRVVLSIPVAISRHEAVVLTDVIRELKALPSAGPRWPNDDGIAQWGLGDARGVPGVKPNPARILQPSTSSCPAPVAVSGRDFLINLYLDWRNNWLSVEAFAQHHGLTDQQAIALLATARTVVGQPHPES